MARSRFLAFFVLVFAASSIAQKAADTRLRIASPGGQIVFILSDASHTHAIDPTSSDLRYSVDFHAKWLMDESLLGLKIEGQPPIGPGMKQFHLDRRPHDESSAAPLGKPKRAVGSYNAARVDLVDESGRKLTLEIRVYDDGVAFRYILPMQPALRAVRVEGELTQFIYNKNATVYSSLVGESSGSEPHPRAIGNVPPQWLVQTPLIGQQIGYGWTSIGESRIAGYPGMDLRKDKSALGFDVELASASTGKRAALSPPAQAPLLTSWRVLAIADDRSHVVESDLASRLAAGSAQP